VYKKIFHFYLNCVLLNYITHKKKQSVLSQNGMRKKGKNTQILKHADFSSKLKQVYSESDQGQECHRLH